MKLCRQPTTHEATVLPDSVSEIYDDDEGPQSPEQDEDEGGLDQDEGGEGGGTTLAGFITLEDYNEDW